MDHDLVGRRRTGAIPRTQSLKADRRNISTPSTRSRTNTIGDAKSYGDEAGSTEVDPDIDEFRRVTIYAYYNLCTLTLMGHRKISSLTPGEIPQAIYIVFDIYWCSHGDHQTANDTGEGRGPSSGTGQSRPHSSSSTFVEGCASAPGRGCSRPNKRPKNNDEDDYDDANDGDADYDPAKRSGRPREPLWACPFFCSNPGRYRDCLRHKLSRLVDVRAHIKRKHMQALFCPVCGLDFAELRDTQRQDHIRQRNCLPVEDPGAQFPGATLSMWDSITERAKDRALTNRDKWYAIWDILFPGLISNRPSEPYVQTTEIALAAAGYLARFLQNGTWEPLQEIRRLLGPNFRELESRFSDFIDDQERQRETRPWRAHARRTGFLPDTPSSTTAGPRRDTRTNCQSSAGPAPAPPMWTPQLPLQPFLQPAVVTGWIQGGNNQATFDFTPTPLPLSNFFSNRCPSLQQTLPPDLTEPPSMGFQPLPNWDHNVLPQEQQLWLQEDSNPGDEFNHYSHRPPGPP